MIDNKMTKVPYQTNGAHASTTDPKTWTTFERASACPNRDGIGVAFESSCGVVGIDFDHCLTKDLVPDWLCDFITRCDTYCEFSPSATGCHILFIVKEDLELERNRHTLSDGANIEVYNRGRYFTFTGDEMPQVKDIREITAVEFISLLSGLGYPWKKGTITSPITNQKSTKLDDETLLKLMFGARNGTKFRAIWDGDATTYNKGNKSSADGALVTNLAFWSGKDRTQMERLWLASPLGQREKTQERKDYRDLTLDSALEITSEVFHGRNNTFEESDIEFLMSSGKEPFPLLILNNIMRILGSDQHFHDTFRSNEFSHLIESRLLTSEWVTLTDATISVTRQYIAENYPYFRKISKELTTDAIIGHAHNNPVNPPRDYFSSLIWDKVPRLSSWLHNAYGVPDDELHQAIGSNWMKGLVKRVMVPGCQFDQVLVLESPQGWKKSSSIRKLGQPWHVETTLSVDNKDFYLTLAQNVIVEFSEGEILARASVSRIKAEITKTEDQVRPPYERGIVKFKRSCVFALTTNYLELKDDTGNRRWLPILLRKVADTEWIEKNRDQLFAEAYYRAIVLLETTYEYPKESLEELQASRGEHNDYDDKVIVWYAGLTPDVIERGVTLHEAIEQIYGITGKINTLDEIQMRAIFTRSLMLENKVKKINGLSVRRWCATDKTNLIIKDLPQQYGSPKQISATYGVSSYKMAGTTYPNV